MEPAVVQFQLFCEEEKLFLSIPTLEEGVYPKPSLLFSGEHDENQIFITGALFPLFGVSCQNFSHVLHIQCVKAFKSQNIHIIGEFKQI